MVKSEEREEHDDVTLVEFNSQRHVRNLLERNRDNRETTSVCGSVQNESLSTRRRDLGLGSTRGAF